MLKKAKKKSASADWEFVTEVASHSKPGEIHRIDRRIAGEQFAFILHGTPVRCTCKGFVFKTKNGNGDPCRHLEYFVTRPHKWQDTLLGIDKDTPAFVPAPQTDTFEVDVRHALGKAFGPLFCASRPKGEVPAFIASMQLIASARGAMSKQATLGAMTSALSESFGATRKRRIVLVD